MILFFALSLIRALGPSSHEPRDFYIFRLGAELAARGENPYDVPKIQRLVAEKFPDENAKGFRENCGYFLPPITLLVFMPFAMLPWVAAKVAWAIVNALAAYSIARLPALFRHDSEPTPQLLALILPFVLVLNPLATVIPFPVGQTTVIFVGCVSAGLFAFERKMPYLAAVLWVFPFVKPHLAMSLIPLAWYLGGWRPAALLVVIVASMNLLGATVVGGSPMFLRDYLEFLPQTRDAVQFNRVELNPALSSWNRLLFAAGGPLIELGLITTMAGYLVWYGFLLGRVAIAGEGRPSVAWAAAATAAGSVFCCQVLVYEMLFLFIAVPWLRDLFENGHRIRGLLGVVLIGLHMIGRPAMEAATGISAHHPLSVALFALLVLTGPLKPRGVVSASVAAEPARPPA